jgi:hypothetical protein
VLLEKIKNYIIPILIISVISLLFSNILHYYILLRPLDNSKNIFISVLESLKYFVPYLIILIILAFFGSFLIALGLLVFIVGVVFSVIYVMMVSFFILPIMMTEGIHIGNTIARTVKLSHRNFWNNIGWTSVFLILIIIISLVFSTIIMLPFTGSFLRTLFDPHDVGKILDMTTSPAYIILSSVANALTLPLLPIFGFILYFNGRAREEVVQAPSYGDDNYKIRVEDLYAKPLPEEKADEKKD